MNLDLGKNRYGEQITITNNLLCVDGIPDTGYIRAIYKEDGHEIMAIDPPGGPFLSVGDNLQGHIIKSIEGTEKGFKINF